MYVSILFKFTWLVKIRREYREKRIGSGLATSRFTSLNDQKENYADLLFNFLIFVNMLFYFLRYVASNVLQQLWESSKCLALEKETGNGQLSKIVIPKCVMDDSYEIFFFYFSFKFFV